jgi:hypothetical protein
MAIRIEPYTPDWEPAVGQFNQRLQPQQLAVTFRFPERHVPHWLPPSPGRRIFQEQFLAVEDGTTVRGGFILKTQDVALDGQIHTVANLQLPLSEGIVNPQYSFVGVQLVMAALRRQPLLYSLGMGGLDNPYPRLLKGLGWSLSLVPFLFRVVHPSRFFRRLPRLRTTPARRLAGDLLAFSGAGWIGLKTAQGLAARRVRPSQDRRCQVEVVPRFDSWADEIWSAAQASYALVPVRDRDTLEALYGSGQFPGLIILKMTRDNRTIGWAAVLDTPMKGHRHFGDLRVGAIADGFASTDDAPTVLAAASAFLEDRGVDLIVSNQLHRAWIEGLKAAGFLEGPSNFALALSKKLAAQLGTDPQRLGASYFNRGDGDGPINL